MAAENAALAPVSFRIHRLTSLHSDDSRADGWLESMPPALEAHSCHVSELQHPPKWCSEADAVWDSILAASTPGQHDWLSAEPSPSMAFSTQQSSQPPTQQQQKQQPGLHPPQQPAPEQQRRQPMLPPPQQSPSYQQTQHPPVQQQKQQPQQHPDRLSSQEGPGADINAAWMDGQLGEGWNDAESWLCDAGRASRSLRRTSSEGAVVPIPRLPAATGPSTSGGIRPCGTTNAAALQARTTGNSRNKRQPLVAAKTRASGRPATPSTLQLAPPAAEPPPRRQTASTTAAVSAPATGSRLWRPTSSAATSPTRQSLPGSSSSGVFTPRTQPAAHRVSPLKGPGQPGQVHAPAHTELQAQLHVQAQAQVQPQEVVPAQMSPSSKVSSWLHSGQLSVKAAATTASGSSSPSSGGGSPTWRISAARASAALDASAAAAARTTSLACRGQGLNTTSTSINWKPSSQLHQALGLGLGTRSDSEQSFAVPGSRIPRPIFTSSAASRPAGASSTARDSLAHARRSESALKQLAQRALAGGASGSAIGSGISRGSPTGLRHVHVRRQSSLSGAATVGAATTASQPGSPSKQTFYSAQSARSASLVSAPASPTACRPESSSCPITPLSCHCQSTTGSFPPTPTGRDADSTKDSSSSSRSEPSSPSTLRLPLPLDQARAAAAAQLQAVQAEARAAAEEYALLSRVTPEAWVAACAAAAAAAAATGSSPSAADSACPACQLDHHLAQLDTLTRCLSEATGQLADMEVEEALNISRRASCNSNHLAAVQTRVQEPLANV